MSNQVDMMGKDLENIAKQTWQVFAQNAATFIIAFLVLVVLGGVTIGIMAPVLTVAYVRMIQNALLGKKIEVSDLFESFDRFANAFIVGLLMGLGIGVGFSLLFIPGLAVLTITLFAIHFIAYDNCTVSQAFSGSWQLLKKNPLLVLITVAALLVANAIGSLVGGVGFLLTGPLSIIALTIIYERLHVSSRLLNSRDD